MELSDQDREILERLEEELWREETRFDIRRMEEVLAEDFFEFGRSGRFYGRADTLAIPRGPIDAVLPLSDFKARLLTQDLAQLTYKSAVTYDGAACAPVGASSGPAHPAVGCCGFIKAHQSRVTPSLSVEWTVAGKSIIRSQ
jgi:hypothetical protein